MLLVLRTYFNADVIIFSLCHVAIKALCKSCFSRFSSMVIRDLTLRSAASFGSFHLIRLLYDEYMFYLVEHKVADATGESPIAVMGEVRQVRYSVVSLVDGTVIFYHHVWGDKLFKI